MQCILNVLKCLKHEQSTKQKWQVIQSLSIPENEDCAYIRYLEQVKHLLGNILLLNICTLLLYFIRMYAQSCFPISFFNWSTRNQISQRNRLPPTFRPEHLNIIHKCKNWLFSNKQYIYFCSKVLLLKFRRR